MFGMRLALLIAAAVLVAPGTAAAASLAPRAANGGGDIPDNQVFLRYTSTAGHWSIRYPEGWARTGNGAAISFRDRGNAVRVAVAAGAAPTPATVVADVRAIRGASAAGRVRTLKLGGGMAVELTFTSVGPPDPVTGKRLTITTDRYELGSKGRVATLDLSTPVGVDNVDAFRLISDSFRWR